VTLEDTAVDRREREIAEADPGARDVREGRDTVIAERWIHHAPLLIGR
jgi:hypothetical protein